MCRNIPERFKINNNSNDSKVYLKFNSENKNKNWNRLKFNADYDTKYIIIIDKIEVFYNVNECLFWFFF